MENEIVHIYIGRDHNDMVGNTLCGKNGVVFSDHSSQSYSSSEN